MSPSPETYALPPDPRGNACGAVYDALKALRGAPVEIDASAVTRMDTLAAQVLLIAKKTWHADGVTFAITNTPTPMRNALQNLGLEAAILGQGAQHVD